MAQRSSQAKIQKYRALRKNRYIASGVLFLAAVAFLAMAVVGLYLLVDVLLPLILAKATVTALSYVLSQVPFLSAIELTPPVISMVQLVGSLFMTILGTHMGSNLLYKSSKQFVKATALFRKIHKLRRGEMNEDDADDVNANIPRLVRQESLNDSFNLSNQYLPFLDNKRSHKHSNNEMNQEQIRRCSI